MVQPVPCAIALGSNLGDSYAILEGAIASLREIPGMTLQARSQWYQTAPVGPPQPDYLNGCILVETHLAPLDLLETLLQVEKQFGRVRRERWGPRSLDLDLLLYGEQILDLPQLQVPHPRMAERAFVLVPLSEIAPDWRHPVLERSVSTLVQAIDCSGVRRLEN